MLFHCSGHCTEAVSHVRGDFDDLQGADHSEACHQLIIGASLSVACSCYLHLYISLLSSCWLIIVLPVQSNAWNDLWSLNNFCVEKAYSATHWTLMHNYHSMFV